MSHDNVTPFRPRPRRAAAPQQDGGFGLRTHRGKALLAHLMTIAAFVLSLLFRAPPLSFIALGVAVGAVFFVYANRGAGMPWANTHHEHALRTLIVGYSIMTLLSVLVMVFSTSLTLPQVLAATVAFAFWGSLATILWALIRALIALVLAAMRKAVPNPRGWLV